MLIGVVGAPNKGKSTFFSAATLVDAAIANYPFTTISPNHAVTYVRAVCPHAELGIGKCDPKNSKCISGVRLVPVGIVDVPGLVPEAHLGKGLGNRFLDSIREADALIQVVDGSGRTDLFGNPSEGQDPMAETEFLRAELASWIAQIMLRDEKPASSSEIARRLSGLKIEESLLLACARECGLDIGGGAPDADGALRLAKKLVASRLPISVAFNKIDVGGAWENFEKVAGSRRKEVFTVSAAAELALRKADASGLISYPPGSVGFEILGTPDNRQSEALEGMRRLLEANGGSGVQRIIDHVVREVLGGIVVYPVEDEHKFCNHRGEVLPDALLVKKGTTMRQLAAMVHSDLADRFIGAVDARRRLRVGADHALAEGDVIKVIAGR